jgi:ribosomal protein L11 methyltransferase
LALLAYFQEEPVSLRQALAGLADLRIEPATLPEVDWVARFREGFRPFRLGRFLIAPPWSLPLAPGPDERLLVVDPGRAFGTGTHESTRLCLSILEELAATTRLGQTLDLGTGTGILAVAAALRGAGPVVAVDVDAEAVASARRHASLNDVELRLLQGDGGRALRPGAFDLVLANLTAPLLCARALEIGQLLAPGASLVLAGLLGEELESVRAAYASLGALAVRSDGEWAALLVQRKRP